MVGFVVGGSFLAGFLWDKCIDWKSEGKIFCATISSLSLSSSSSSSSSISPVCHSSSSSIASLRRLW